MTAASTSHPLLAALLQPSFYDHAVKEVELIETHISWVFLTGSYAYKIKKPVNFGFLDFSTLEKRKYYCEEELRLNGRLAPEIYLSVIPITESNGTLTINGTGQIIEYAIKMRQFDPKGLFSLLFDQGHITLSHMEKLAERLSDFHAKASIADNSLKFGTVDEVIKPVEQNFNVIKPLVTSPEIMDQLEAIQKYSLIHWQQLHNTFKQRKQQGHIRECHGDLHLGNIALSDDEIIIFDGIEFNDAFRWIDTMSDIAFLVMDLEDHNGSVHATHVLNHYLELTGDYAGLQVINFYKQYRAMVRAKVAALRLQQESENSPEHIQTLHQLTNYLDLAQQYTKPHHTFVAIMHGISGSGKTWCAGKISDQCNAIVISSDRERKRLFSHQADELYSKDTTKKTYQHLLALTQNIIISGYSVIVDATFLNPEWRKQFMNVAQRSKTPFHILSCHTNEQTLEKRLANRQHDPSNISDADITIMRQQLRSLQPLSKNEKPYTISIETSMPIDVYKISNTLCHLNDD